MASDDLQQTIRSFLLQSFVPDASEDDLPGDLDLIENGILDSLALVETASFLEGLVGDEVEAHELTPKNLGSIDKMAAFVRKRRAA